VTQRGGGTGLAFEPVAPFRVLREVGRQGLDGDVTPEAMVTGAVDIPYAPRAKRRESLVGAETHARTDGHGVPPEPAAVNGKG